MALIYTPGCPGSEGQGRLSAEEWQSHTQRDKPSPWDPYFSLPVCLPVCPCTRPSDSIPGHFLSDRLYLAMRSLGADSEQPWPQGALSLEGKIR